jgi:hypothetical protein
MVLDTVRVFNKRVLNPVMLLVAGRKYWYAGVIEHTGRRSGHCPGSWRNMPCRATGDHRRGNGVRAAVTPATA